MDWSKQQTLDLIEHLRVHECLWNVKNEDYRDRQKKKESLEVIACHMAISDSDVDKKITNLKNQYNREVNKIKAKSGADDVFSSTWYAFNPLSFLRNNYLPKRRRHSNSTAEEENYDDEGINFNDSIKVEVHHKASTSGVSDMSAVNEEIIRPVKRFRQTETAMPMFSETHDIMNTNVKDEFDVFGEFVASELRGIVGKKNILQTKKEIQDLIYFRKLEQINMTASSASQNMHQVIEPYQ